MLPKDRAGCKNLLLIVLGFFPIESGMLVLRRLSQQPRSGVRLKFGVRARKSLELPRMWFSRGAAKGWVRLQWFLPQQLFPGLQLIPSQGIGVAQCWECRQTALHRGPLQQPWLLPHLPSPAEWAWGCPCTSLLPFPVEMLLEMLSDHAGRWPGRIWSCAPGESHKLGVTKTSFKEKQQPFLA